MQHQLSVIKYRDTFIVVYYEYSGNEFSLIYSYFRPHNLAINKTKESFFMPVKQK